MITIASLFCRRRVRLHTSFVAGRTNGYDSWMNRSHCRQSPVAFLAGKSPEAAPIAAAVLFRCLGSIGSLPCCTTPPASAHCGNLPTTPRILLQFESSDDAWLGREKFGSLRVLLEEPKNVVFVSAHPGTTCARHWSRNWWEQVFLAKYENKLTYAGRNNSG